MQKVMVVTGGSRGIGAEIARSAAAAGYAVAVNYTRAREAADALAGGVREKGGKAIAVGADVANADDVARLFRETAAALGPVDVLVNNAGISVSTSLAESRPEDIDLILGVNIRGPILCAREAVRSMAKERGGKGGVIINIGSISSTYGGLPNDVIYAASKGGVDALTLGLAKEVAGSGIRVCCVRPGLTLTEMLDADFGPGRAAEVGRKTVPLGRIGMPEDIARAVLFLASGDASYITGAFLNVSGAREINVKMASD